VLDDQRRFDHARNARSSFQMTDIGLERPDSQ
jgi:hypothetical protein